MHKVEFSAPVLARIDRRRAKLHVYEEPDGQAWLGYPCAVPAPHLPPRRARGKIFAELSLVEAFTPGHAA